jgi:hypothetical protein
METVSITKTTMYALKVGDVTWRFPSTRVVVVETQEFVVLSPTEFGFIKLICAGLVDTLPYNPSVAGLKGVREMQRIRNEEQSKSMDPASALFTKAKRRRVMRSRSEQVRMRYEPSHMDVVLPRVGDLPDLEVRMLRPVTQHDRLAILLDPQTVSHVVQYIRAHGDVNDKSLTANKRRYTRDIDKDAESVEGDGAGNEDDHRAGESAEADVGEELQHGDTIE